jgi:transketolase
MKPAVRVAALMGLPVVYVFTHDSIGVGEDGPTHQPIEHLANLRSIPNLHMLRPADGRETASAWLHAVKRTDGPTALVLSRQNLPQLTGSGPDAVKGGYIISAESKIGSPDVILIASGSEVPLVMEAKEVLEEKGISTRVVSMMSWELFELQPEYYRDSVLPESCVNRLAVEAGLSMGWERYTGGRGRIISMDRFGASAPGEILMEKFGFTVDNIVTQAVEMLKLAK